MRRLSFDTSVSAAKRAALIAKRRRAASFESPGRKKGGVIGSWVTDLAEIHQAILVCWQCEPKWKRIAKRYHYEPIRRWTEWYGGAWANCDACREWGPQRTCYVHSSTISQV